MIDDVQPDIDAISHIPAVPAILDVVCRSTGMGFAAVARVTESRWIACSVRDEISFGLEPGGELDVETTICHEIRQHREPVIINHVAEDAVYCRHHTPAMYGFQSYISMPILLPDGSFFGTLCAIDPKPRKLNTPEVVGMFKLFAELIAFHLDANIRLTRSEVILSREREMSDLREQFIAVLGHDLRNPLAAISAGAGLLAEQPLDSGATRTLAIIRSGVNRMAALIDDVLDFARGRLGGGLTLDRSAAEPLEPLLRQVIAELEAGSPKRMIETMIALDRPVAFDRVRISQLLSNLLANALTYGTPAAPVRVRAITGDGYFELAVCNAGERIPDAAIERLFQPFARGSVLPDQQGLGLGLYIASEIARAHGGTLTVKSSVEETCFTFLMPLRD
jgi:signal transduction histidine kinase